jgi:hypothetical protein
MFPYTGSAESPFNSLISLSFGQALLLAVVVVDTSVAATCVAGDDPFSLICSSSKALANAVIVTVITIFSFVGDDLSPESRRNSWTLIHG